MINANYGYGLSVTKNEASALLSMCLTSPNRLDEVSTISLNKLKDYVAGTHWMASGNTSRTLLLSEEEAFSLLSLCLTSPNRLDSDSERGLKKLAEYCTSFDRTKSEPTIHDDNLSLELYIDGRGCSAEDIWHVLSTLNDCHIAAGGLGLRFEFGDTYILATLKAVA